MLQIVLAASAVLLNSRAAIVQVRAETRITAVVGGFLGMFDEREIFYV